jgi:pimeloyl-ACP methyl ester carboxylesterase
VTLARIRLEASTSDGRRLAVQRVHDPAQPAQRGAVLMLHGLGANHRIFLTKGVSLAEHLAARGFDCYVPDLRGAGDSERVRDWTLDDYLDRDLPALLECALENSGRTTLACVGHSMGGILIWMHCMEQLGAPIERLVAVGSALDYRLGRNVYQDLRRLRRLAGPLKSFPFGLIARVLSPLAGVGPVLPAEGMNFHRSNVERSVCRELMAHGFGSIPLALFDSLNTTFEADGFSRITRDQGRVVYLQRVAELRLPTLMVAGSADVQCPPATAQATFERLSGASDKRALFVGKRYGQADDYGHLDLLVGKRAAHEVWPELTAFLSAGSDAGAGAAASNAVPAA